MSFDVYTMLQLKFARSERCVNSVSDRNESVVRNAAGGIHQHCVGMTGIELSIAYFVNVSGRVTTDRLKCCYSLI
jgi:hypothetical protein